MGSAAVVESQLARERVDCLDLLIHGQYVVLVVMTVPWKHPKAPSRSLLACRFLLCFLLFFITTQLKRFKFVLNSALVCF